MKTKPTNKVAFGQQPVKLLERDVTQQIRDFLEWKGWRLYRNMVSKAQDSYGNWMQFGESGVTDVTAYYYLPNGVACVMWVELKRLLGKKRQSQIDWQKKERKRGALVVTAHAFEPFVEWYEKQFGWLHQEDWLKGQKEFKLEVAPEQFR